MAAEWTRALATLLLAALSFTVWRMLLQPSTQPQLKHEQGSCANHSRAPSAKTGKKKAKKRAAKKSTAAVSVQDTTAATSAGVTTAGAAASESEGDSDEDEGLSAAQILARRKFTTTKAIGDSRPIAATKQLNVPKFELNQRVFARFQGGTEWFPATITEVRRGNEYNLKYDDGELEFHVPHKLIKPHRGADDAASAASAESAPQPSCAPGASSGSNSDVSPHNCAPSGSDVEDESDEDEGWSIVGASNSKRKSKSAGEAAAGGVVVPPAGDGLTKRQRESRRKKERQREIKELARAQAQENGLHAKWGGTHSKMKYVPPPTQA